FQTNRTQVLSTKRVVKLLARSNHGTDRFRLIPDDESPHSNVERRHSPSMLILQRHRPEKSSIHGRTVMRNLALINLCIATSVLAVSSASAADIGSRSAPREPSYVSPVYNWTGAYLGINGGGAWGRSDFSAPFTSGSFNVSGALFGATLGYN